MDGNSANRRFIKLHSTGPEPVYKATNPFTSENRPLLFFSDPPHLIKTTRNCLASRNRSLWVCGLTDYVIFNFSNQTNISIIIYVLSH